MRPFAASLLTVVFLTVAKPAAAQAERADALHPPGGKVRTLDSITIEGDVDLPEVLFINAREAFRYADRLHRSYLKSCAEIGREARLPRRFEWTQGGEKPWTPSHR